MFSRFALVVPLAGLVLLAGACESTAPKKVAAAPAPLDPAACVTGSIDIYFNQWESELNDFSRDVIATAQHKMQGCVIEHVRIVGMADATGSDAANMEVSAKRAEAIADALAAGGWPRNRFDVRAAGEEGALVNGVNAPMRRRANVSVESRAP